MLTRGMGKPVSAAVLIVRNEARCIERCLASAAPWVDRIVVLDTGSVDETPELARHSGAEVHHLDWPNDFSIARNHALDLADADWNLILDADEWIAGGGETLRSWIAGPPRLGRVAINSSFEDEHGIIRNNVSWVTRLLPRGARFVGRVHEQVVSALPRVKTEVRLDHDGYREAQMASKRDRNRPLLLRELEDRPEDPYLLYQLGKDAEGHDEMALASDYYTRAFARTQRGDMWFLDLLWRHLHALGRTGNIPQALDLALQWIEQIPDSPDLFFVTANLGLDRAIEDPAHALDCWLPLAMSAWKRCLEIGERPDLEGSVIGRGSFLAQQNLELLQGQLAALSGRNS